MSCVIKAQDDGATSGGLKLSCIAVATFCTYRLIYYMPTRSYLYTFQSLVKMVQTVCLATRFLVLVTKTM